jgi:hypothetical protein
MLHVGAGRETELWCIMKGFVLCSSLTNIIWANKWRRMRWAGHVSCMGGEGSDGED